MKNLSRSIALAACAVLGFQSAFAKTVTINLETATFDDLQAAMNAGAITSVELATLYLNRRAVYDQAGIKINSVVSINPAVFDEAQAADDLRASSGQQSPLHGLLYCTKDSYPTLGMVTSGGVRTWLSSVTGTFGTEAGVTYGPMTSPEDCYVVGKLKAAHAIVLGHGNMDTWATSASSTTSNAYGTTLNAYCLGSASGSSGGPGALTGANFANFAWGGETGGSIRNPSDRAGVTGFKVTVGTHSVNHIIPLVSDRDVIGPMARYVKDEAYIMDVTANTIDPQDLWAPINYVPGRGLDTAYVTKVNTTSLAGKKVGIIGTYNGLTYPSPAPTPVQLSEADVEKALGVGNGHGGMTSFTNYVVSGGNAAGVQTPDTATSAVFARFVGELQSSGATVVTVFLPPNIDTAQTIPAVTTPPTSSAVPQFPTQFDDGTTAPGATLASPYTNYSLAFENAGMLSAFGQGIYTRLTQANAASSSLSTAVRAAAYSGQFIDFTSTSFHDPTTGETTLINIPAHFQRKAIYNALFEKFMDANGLDALIWPISYAKSRTSNSVSGRDLVNNIGLPICTVPIGIYTALGGEPICAGFLGRYRKEADTLALAGAYQREYNHRIPSPLLPPLDGETITYTTAGTLFTQRADKLAPVVSIKKSATVKDSKIVIQGVATDASGIGSLKVYVNGRKVASKTGKRWTASVPVSSIKKWTKSKAKTIEVTVMAKDGAGNASATTKIVKI